MLGLHAQSFNPKLSGRDLGIQNAQQFSRTREHAIDTAAVLDHGNTTRYPFETPKGSRPRPPPWLLLLLLLLLLQLRTCLLCSRHLRRLCRHRRLAAAATVAAAAAAVVLHVPII